MDLGPFLFLLFLVIASDTIAAAVGAFLLWSHRRVNGNAPFAVAGAVLLVALFTEGLLLLFANGFGFEVKPVRTLGYVWCYWIGRAARSLALWAFVLIMLAKPRVDLSVAHNSGE